MVLSSEYKTVELDLSWPRNDKSEFSITKSNFLFLTERPFIQINVVQGT